MVNNWRLMPHLYYCRQCNAMVATTPNGVIVEHCACGSRYFVQPHVAPWRLTEFDHRFLISLRISPESELNGRWP